MYKYTYMYTYSCICMYIYIYVYIHIYVYIYTYIYKSCFIDLCTYLLCDYVCVIIWSCYKCNRRKRPTHMEGDLRYTKRDLCYMKRDLRMCKDTYVIWSETYVSCVIIWSCYKCNRTHTHAYKIIGLFCRIWSLL